MKNYWKIAAKYADGVIAGKIPACRYVKLACKRFVKDCQRKDIYPSDDGNVWCDFIEQWPHVKGKWAGRGEKFELSDYQVFVIVNVYGWKWTKTDRRRFREAYEEVGRKNGKSFKMAAIGLGHLCIDGEMGAEVYCGATSEKQAWEVFRPAKWMVERSPDLAEKYGIAVHAKRLIVPHTGSRFEPVIGNPGDGSSPSCGIADEFHEHENSDLSDCFITGMGAREQPVMWYITTAGVDMGGPCFEKRGDVIKILEGAVEDDSVFGIIYTIDEKDRWDTLEAQKKANPNYGISIEPDFLAGQLEQAKRSAQRQVAYKTKHLNVWVGAKAAWMNMLAFQACRKKALKIESFKGRDCFLALDLASKVDVAVLAAVFPPLHAAGKWAAFCRHYVPEEKVLEGGNTRYKAWHAEGRLIATPGNVTDFDYIADDMEEMKSKFQIIEVPFDPFQAIHFSTQMLAKGFPMIEYGATVKNFSEPMKMLEALILKKEMEFELNDPVLLWMFGNVVARMDKKDNIFPDKERPENKIDGVVAIIMALARALLHREDDFTGEIRTIDL